MRRAVIVMALALGVFGCSTTKDLPVEEPRVNVRQLGDVSIIIEQGGSIPIAYLVTIRNEAEIPLALRSVELTMMGGGPYSIRQRNRFYPREIAPGETTEVRVDALLSAPGGRNRSSEPVLMRARVSFNSDEGSFQTQTLTRIYQ